MSHVVKMKREMESHKKSMTMEFTGKKENNVAKVHNLKGRGYIGCLTQAQTKTGRPLNSIRIRSGGKLWSMSSFEGIPHRWQSIPGLSKKLAMSVFTECTKIMKDSNMNKHNTALIRASGFYLCEHLTEELLDGSETELDMFLEANLWEPFEGWSADDIYGEISKLAESFEELMI